MQQFLIQSGPMPFLKQIANEIKRRKMDNKQAIPSPNKTL